MCKLSLSHSRAGETVDRIGCIPSTGRQGGLIESGKVASSVSDHQEIGRLSPLNTDVSGAGLSGALDISAPESDT